MDWRDGVWNQDRGPMGHEKRDGSVMEKDHCTITLLANGNEV